MLVVEPQGKESKKKRPKKSDEMKKHLSRLSGAGSLFEQVIIDATKHNITQHKITQHNKFCFRKEKAL